MINKKILKQVYIQSIGVYIPPFRVKTSVIASAYDQVGDHVSQALGVKQKAVADTDEDSLTMATMAAYQALASTSIEPSSIGAVFVGSESHPYAVKPTGSMVAQWLGLNPNYFCADLEFACKAGTAGLQIVAALLEAGMIEAGLVIGTDKAQSKPGDPLEYTAAAAATAFILTNRPTHALAQLKATHSYNTDTPDFWRRQTQSYPEHAGRFTGEPAYFKHIQASIEQLFNTYHKTMEDFEHVVFHMPNGKFPSRLAQQLGVSRSQLELGFTVQYIGNPYSSSSLLGMAHVLLNAKPQQHILVASYGSGSGSDTFWLEQKLAAKPAKKTIIKQQLTQDISLNYLEYLQKMRIL